MKLYILVLVLVLLLAGCTSQNTNDAPENLSAQNASNETDGNLAGGTLPEGSVIVYVTEMEMHNSADDCWVLFEGQVYDITKFLPNHPNGSDTLSGYCGKSDSSFEDAFIGKHNDTKVEVLKSEGTDMGALGAMNR